MKREGLLQNKRWIIAIVMAGLAVCTLIWWIVGSNTSIVGRNLPTENSEALYAVDVNNPRALVGFVDYTFVGVVESIEDTAYRSDEHMSYTNYKIRVLHNIKGDLVLDSIPVTKKGGLAKNQTEYMLFQDDFLPNLGDVCVFNAYTQEEGWLLLSGKNSNVLLFTADYKQGMSSDTLLEQVWSTKGFAVYQDGFTNQIKDDRHPTPRISTLDATVAQATDSATKNG
jgi:hypothetical protein